MWSIPLDPIEKHGWYSRLRTYSLILNKASLLAGPLMSEYLQVMLDISSTIFSSFIVCSGEGRGPSKSKLAGAVAGSFFFCLLVGAAIVISLVLFVVHIKTTRHRRRRRSRRNVRLPIGSISARKHQVYDKLSLNSPGMEKIQQFEFPRGDLELQEVLGIHFVLLCLLLYYWVTNTPLFSLSLSLSLSLFLSLKNKYSLFEFWVFT